MRTFANIHTTFWTGPTGRVLRKHGPLAQVLAIYLFSSPHATFMGIYRLPLAYITCDLNITIEQARDTLALLQESGFAKYDEENEIVFIVNGAEYQYGKTLKPLDKNVPAVRREFSVIPIESPLRAEFFDKYVDTFLHLNADGTPKDEGDAKVSAYKARAKATKAPAARAPAAAKKVAPAAAAAKTTAPNPGGKVQEALDEFILDLRAQNGEDAQAEATMAEIADRYIAAFGDDDACFALKQAPYLLRGTGLSNMEKRLSDPEAEDDI